MRKSATWECLLTLGMFLVGSSSIQAAPIFGPNLVVNGDAEAGTGSVSGNDVLPVPGWTTSGNFTVVQYNAPGGFPTTSDPSPSNRGANFFAGGPDNSSSSALQAIDVSSESFTIDTGSVTFALEGFLGGFDGQGDNAVLTTTFLSAASTILGMASIGPVTLADRNGVTGLLFTTTSGFLPVGTRSVELNLQMTRLQGSYNDGYADNLSFVLTPFAVPEPSTLSLGIAGILGLFWYSKRGQARFIR